jgi:hypothetical protein
MQKQESSSGNKRLIGHTTSPITLNISLLTYTQSQQKQNNSFTFIFFPLPNILITLLIGKMRVVGGGSSHLCKVRLHSSNKQKSRGSNIRASFSKKSFPFVSAPTPHSAFEATSLVRPLRPALHMHWRVSQRRLCLMDKAYVFFSKARNCLELDACRTVQSNWKITFAFPWQH